MSRGRLLWMGAVALLLMFGAWWFTVASAATGQIQVLAPIGVPAFLLIASIFLFLAGWRKGISGLFVLATTIVGIGVVGLLQWLTTALTDSAAWLLLPAFTGTGILIENHIGIGWRFTDRQGAWMLITSLGLFLAVVAFSNIPFSTLGAISRFFSSFGHPTVTATPVDLGQIYLPILIQFDFWR